MGHNPYGPAAVAARTGGARPRHTDSGRATPRAHLTRARRQKTTFAATAIRQRESVRSANLNFGADAFNSLIFMGYPHFIRHAK